VLKPFCSIQNKILVDYKKFKEWAKDELQREAAKLSTKAAVNSTPKLKKFSDLRVRSTAAAKLNDKMEVLKERIEEMKNNETIIQNHLAEHSSKDRDSKSALSKKNLI